MKIKVKPLEWVEGLGGYSNCTIYKAKIVDNLYYFITPPEFDEDADDDFNHDEFYIDIVNNCDINVCGFDFEESATTLEEAKSICQAHIEKLMTDAINKFIEVENEAN